MSEPLAISIGTLLSNNLSSSSQQSSDDRALFAQILKNGLAASSLTKSADIVVPEKLSTSISQNAELGDEEFEQLVLNLKVLFSRSSDISTPEDASPLLAGDNDPEGDHKNPESFIDNAELTLAIELSSDNAPKGPHENPELKSSKGHHERQESLADDAELTLAIDLSSGNASNGHHENSASLADELAIELSGGNAPSDHHERQESLADDVELTPAIELNKVDGVTGFSEATEVIDQIELNVANGSEQPISVIPEGVAVVAHRQFVTQSGNELPSQPQSSSAESLLEMVDQLSPEQFDELLSQLPEMAESLKKSLTSEGYPVFSNMTLKNIKVVDGKLVSINAPSAGAKAAEIGVVTPDVVDGEPVEATLDNKSEGQQKNIQINAQAINTSASQYRAQALQNSNQSTVDAGRSEADSSSSISLDGIEGSKSQQHDRLMATVSAMRQNMVVERRSVDTRQQELREVVVSDALGDEGEGSFEGLHSTTMPTMSSGQALSVSTINLPVQHPRWGNAVSEKVVWMMNAQLKEAEIRLNPNSLGSIEIKLSMVDDQANVAFNVHTSQAKEALESALPRLREMLAESGIVLNDTDVSEQSEHENSEQQMSGSEDARHSQEEQAAHDEIISQRVMDVFPQSGVDIYI